MNFIEGFRRALTQRIDGWLNLTTGLATTSGRTDFRFVRGRTISDDELEEIFGGSAYAARIVTQLPLEALRKGLDVNAGDADTNTKIKAKLDELELRSKFFEAWTWGRLFGGALVFVGANDGLDPREPLNVSRVTSVDFLTVVEKRDAFPSSWYRDPTLPTFGKVERYRFSRSSTGGGVDSREVHATRCIRFGGALTTPRRRQELNGWDDSELRRVLDELTQFSGAMAAGGTLLQDASQAVYKLKDLMSMMAGDKQDRLKTRLELMDLSRSVARAIMIDADGEEFERKDNGSLAGVPPVIEKFMQQLAGAAGMPVTILMGMSPAGLNATGESDVRSWYATVESAQTQVLIPRTERVVKLVMLSTNGPTGGEEPESWEVTCPSLWTMSPKEEAELRKSVAETDKIYVDMQAISGDEVAVNRFRPEGWSAETSIDTEAREQALAADATPPDQAAATIEGQPAAPVDPNAKDPAAALNGAQIKSLQEIVQAVASRQLPRASGIAMILASFPLSPTQAEAIMGETGSTFFTTPDPTKVAELDSMREQHAAATRSNTSLRAMLKRVLAKNRAGELVSGSPVGAGGGAEISDQEVDAIMEALPPEVDGEP